MQTQRIGYIDAMRGFTMFLVVYSHVLMCSFRGQSAFSFNDIFMTFRMPLFFFLSGFLMYKANRFSKWSGTMAFIRKKGVVQLVPTLLFSIVYALVFRVSYPSLLMEKAKCGFWFTYTLFFFFAIYACGDFAISRFAKGKVKILLGALVAAAIWAFSKYSLSPSCPWRDSFLYGAIGYANFQFFLFFFFGALVRAKFDTFEKMIDKPQVLAGVLTVFVMMQLLLQLPLFSRWITDNLSYSVYSLIRAISAFFGIVTVFAFFRKNRQITLRSAGKALKFIGERTLDIYLIHLLLIHTDMSFAGEFLARFSSPVTEFVLCTLVSLIIMGLCLIISQILRSSDILAKLLFGKVIVK